MFDPLGSYRRRWLNPDGLRPQASTLARATPAQLALVKRAALARLGRGLNAFRSTWPSEIDRDQTAAFDHYHDRARTCRTRDVPHLAAASAPLRELADRFPENLPMVQWRDMSKRERDLHASARAGVGSLTKVLLPLLFRSEHLPARAFAESYWPRLLPIFHLPEADALFAIELLDGTATEVDETLLVVKALRDQPDALRQSVRSLALDSGMSSAEALDTAQTLLPGISS